MNLFLNFGDSKNRPGLDRQPIAVSDISIHICLIDIRSKSKEQLNERRAGLSDQDDERKNVSQSEGLWPQQNRRTGQNEEALSIMGLPNINVEILLQ